MYADKNNEPIEAGDTVEKDGKKYIVKVIACYATATEVIVESVTTHQVKTFLLHDVKKVK